jgi:hypothetical protein
MFPVEALLLLEIQQLLLVHMRLKFVQLLKLALVSCHSLLQLQLMVVLNCFFVLLQQIVCGLQPFTTCQFNNYCNIFKMPQQTAYVLLLLVPFFQTCHYLDNLFLQ